MKKIFFSLFLLFSCPVSAQWKEFVEQYGTHVPFDYFNPYLDYQKKVEWYAKVRPVLEKYAFLVSLEMNCRGFQIEEITISLKEQYSNTAFGWAYGGTVIRGGLSMKFLLFELTPVRYSPTEYVDNLEKTWENMRNVLLDSPETVSQFKDVATVKNWRELFFYMPQQRKCTILFTPGSVCTIDLSSGSVSVKP